MAAPLQRLATLAATLLALAGGGALVCWSRVQGGTYRLLTARFDSDAWTAPRPVGPPAAIEPRFAAGRQGVFLVYRQGRPAGWSVLELTGDPAVRRRAALATARRGRPILVAGPAGPALRWEQRGAPEPLVWGARP